MDSGGTEGAREPSEVTVESPTGSRNPIVEWVLIEGDRVLLTALGAATFFVALQVLHALGVIAFTNDDSVTRMASGMTAGTFSLVTVVVSVNQLILSQEFSPADEFRDRLEGVLSFRQDVKEATDVATAPAAPTRLLSLLTDTIRHRATVLAEAAAENDDPDRELIRRYAETVTDSTEYLDETIEHSRGDVLEAISVSVQYDDSWQLYAARYLRDGTDGLSEETTRAFDDLIESLRHFSIAQAHFKTIYLQRELTRFSQLTVYSGLPAIAAAALIVLVYGDAGGGAIRPTLLPHVTSLLASVVFVPLSLMAAYILRVATLTRRTASVGPMYVQTEGEGPFETADSESE